MGFKTHLLIFSLALGLGASPRVAADDLYTILQLAMENDPTLRRAEASYRANRQGMIQRRAALLPSLGAGGSTSRLTSGPAETTYEIIRIDENGIPRIVHSLSGRRAREYTLGEGEIIRRIDDHSFHPGINNHGWGLSLNQSLFNLSSWYDFRSAQASNRAGLADLAAQEQDLIMRVAGAYFDVLRALDTLETNIQEEEAAQTSFEQISQRQAVGLVPITDLYDSEAAYDLARNTTILQRDVLQSRYEALEAITGQPHPNLDLLREDFPVVEVDGDLTDWEGQARDNSLALATAQFNLQASQKTLRARQAAHLPTISIEGMFGHSVTQPIVNQGIMVGGGASDRTSLSLSLNLPLFTGGATSAQRRAAAYNVTAAQQSLEFTKRQLTQNIRNAYRRVNTDVLVIAQRQQSITSARSRLEATELGAEVGTRNIVEVLLARENLYRALRQYDDARYNYVIDSLVLKQVAGILTPQDVIELNRWLQDPAEVDDDGDDNDSPDDDDGSDNDGDGDDDPDD